MKRKSKGIGPVKSLGSHLNIFFFLDTSDQDTCSREHTLITPQTLKTTHSASLAKTENRSQYPPPLLSLYPPPYTWISTSNTIIIISTSSSVTSAEYPWSYLPPPLCLPTCPPSLPIICHQCDHHHLLLLLIHLLQNTTKLQRKNSSERNIPKCL